MVSGCSFLEGMHHQLQMQRALALIFQAKAQLLVYLGSFFQLQCINYNF